MRGRTVGIVLSVSLGMAALALAAAPDREAAQLTTASCASGTHVDPGRTVRIVHELRRGLAQLTSSADAKQLAGLPLDQFVFCYADSSALHEPTQVVLDTRLDERQAAARAAHLLLHAWVAPPWPTSSLSCAEKVRAALEGETRAHELEQAIATVLDTRAVPERTQAQLAAEYAERCRRERR